LILGETVSTEETKEVMNSIGNTPKTRKSLNNKKSCKELPQLPQAQGKVENASMEQGIKDHHREQQQVVQQQPTVMGGSPGFFYSQSPTYSYPQDGGMRNVTEGQVARIWGGGQKSLPGPAEN
jgi:hypothetical protein